MPRLNGKVPKYRLHRPSGQAVVTLNYTDHYLGLHGTEQSRAVYDRLSPSTGYNGNSDASKKNYVESFAFCWKPARVKLRSPAGLASTPYINHPVFRQVPFVGDFEVVGGNGFDFREEKGSGVFLQFKDSRPLLIFFAI